MVGYNEVNGQESDKLSFWMPKRPFVITACQKVCQPRYAKCNEVKNSVRVGIIVVSCLKVQERKKTPRS
jgi:hypothetical protein